MTSQMMTTEQLRTQRKPDDVEAGFGTYRGFQAMSHMAESLANSSIIPEAFRNTIMVKDYYDNQAKKWIFKPESNPNGISNCIIALNMAQRLGADPMMIMQNLYLVDGRPSWSSQFIIAAINSSGRYSPLRFDITGGEEEVEIPYAVTEWVYNKETKKREPVESNQVARVKNYKCVAWVIEKATGERLESTPITMEMAVKEGWYQKNGSKWQSMPEQMLRYRAASFFGRIYAPDLLMGLKTQEEEQDSVIDVTPPEPAIQAIPVTLDSIKQNVVKESVVEDVAPVESTPVAEVKEPVQRTRTASANRVSETKPPIEKVAVEAKQPAKEQPKPVAIDPLKSEMAKGGLLLIIQKSKDIAELEATAKTITQTRDRLTTEHHQELLQAYAQRKEILSQADIFEDEPEPKMSYVESAINRILNARSLDDIHGVYADPSYEELSDADRELIDQEAQQREAELQD